MTNRNPTISSSNATGSFSENANTTGSNALHNLSGTMNFTDSDRNDSHTVSTSLKTKTLSSGTVIPAATLAQINTAMSSSIVSDSNGSGKLKWQFSAEDDTFDFLSKNQTLTLTYEVKLKDNHGGQTTKLVTITITGTDDKPVIDFGTQAVVSERVGQTLSFAPDTAHIAVHFTDVDLTNTGHTATVTDVSASGATGGLLPGVLGELELRSFFQIDSVVKASGSANGTINTTFSAPDLAFDYLSQGETVDITYTIKLDDRAGGITTQTVVVTVIGTNDGPKFLCGPESAHLVENENLSPSGELTASGELLFGDIDLSDAHTVSTTVTATNSSGDPVPLTEAQLLAALTTSLDDSTGHLLGEVDWSFAIANSDIIYLDEGETLTITYNITLTDDAGGTTTQTVTVTIEGKADPFDVNPVTATAADTAIIDANTIVASGNVIIDGGDSSGTPGATLSVTAVNGSGANVGAPIAGAYGDLYIFSDGTYYYIANANLDPLQVGDNFTETYNFTVADNFGHSETTTLTLNITGADDAPTITSAVASGTMTEDAGPTLVVNGNFESGDLTGWGASSPNISAEFVGFGGSFGDYSVRLAPGGFSTLTQNIATTAGQQYTVTFYVSGDPESTGNQFTATWGGFLLTTINDNTNGGLNAYSFVVTADDSNTPLHFTYATDGIGMYLDLVTVESLPGPATESADGSISFADVETGDTHTASFTPQGMDYVGTFSLDPVSESGGAGTVAWHYTVDNADIQFLALGQTLTQTYSVFVTDDQGQSAVQDVTITINGANDAPATVGDDHIITNADVNGGIFIPDWVLTRNDIDPDTGDALSVNSITGNTGGSASFFFGSLIWFDDSTLGGSFEYNTSDGSAVSAGSGTVTVDNNPAGTTVLLGTGDDDIIIAVNGGETLNGGGGDDVLIGNGGSHVLIGGTGDDVFAFQVVPDQGPAPTNLISDFDNLIENDMIAISAAAFGSDLSVGMDASTVFESSADAEFFVGGSRFHYDTSTDILYFSADGSTASAIVVAQLQPGVLLTGQDLMIV